MGWKRHLKKKKKGRRKNNPTSESSAPPPSPSWIDLPRDMTANILRRLGSEEILDKAETVCTTWRSVCREFEPSFWRTFDMKYFDNLRLTYGRAGRVCRRAVKQSDRVCRRAVERSQGELMDIKFMFFGTNDLLQYVSQRCSSHLKILRIQSCDSISIQGLTKALKNFHCLEELHLFLMPSIYTFDIEKIGVSCPMLKSFTLHRCYPINDEGNQRALSIAKNMPNLNCLSLFGNLYMSNKGLQAILDGCPNLVFLDLRKCLKVSLQGGIRRRCSEQIKELKRPQDGLDEEELKDPFYYDAYFN